MAPPAGEVGRRGRVGELIALLAPSSGRWEFAGRQALICALTVLVVEFYQTPDPALTVYLVFFLNRADRASSLVMNGALLVLITLVIGMVLMITRGVIDQPPFRLACMAGLSFALLFLTSASKLRPVGAIIALITGYALDLLGSAHSGEIAARALLYAWLFAAIPAGVSMAVNLLIAPSPRRLIERALAERLRAGAAALRSGGDGEGESGEGDGKHGEDDDGLELRRYLEEGLGEIPAWLKLAGLEKTSPAGDIAALRRAADSTLGVLLLIELTRREACAALPAALRDRLARRLEEMATIFLRGTYPLEIDLDIEDSERESQWPPMTEALLTDFRNALGRFTDPAPDPESLPPPAAPGHGGFFLPDAFSNPEHVRYALKTTAAAMFCYCLYSLLDWPGIHTCLITCYIVALSTTAEAVEKLTLRIVGCLVGAAIGILAIVFLVPSLTSIGALMAVVSAGAFAAAWVAGGSPRIAYAGFQVAFAFFLCVIQGPAPAFDMVTARDRIIGILVGNVVSYLVFVYLWPVSVARRIDPAIGALLRSLGDLAAAGKDTVRWHLAAMTLASRGSIGRDVGLLAYEPAGLRPSPAWVESRARSLDEMAALTAPLLLAADRHPQLGAQLARRISRLASLLNPAGPQDPTNLRDAAAASAELPGGTALDRGAPDHTDDTSTAVDSLLERHLAALERVAVSQIRSPGAEPS